MTYQVDGLPPAVDEPLGTPFSPLAVTLSLTDPYQFFGRRNAVVRKNRDTGETLCWGQGSGANYYRPFGVVTPGPYSVPSPFPVPVAYGGVALDGGQVCGYGTGAQFGFWSWVATADGSYYFQGDNSQGAAGNGTTNGANNPDPPANLVYTKTCTLPFAGTEIVHVSTGPNAVMILRRNGEVWGVGGSYYNGTNFHGFPGVGDLTTWRKIADYCVYCDCFDSGGAVVKKDGRIKFTGNNAAGRYGLGSSGETFTAWQTVAPEIWGAGGGFKKVRVQELAAPHSAGSSLSLRNDGTMWFAGSNSHRLCGNPAIDAGGSLTTLTRVPGIPPIRDFDANEAACYALDYDGRLWVWGTQAEDASGNVGALGNTGPYEQPTPFVLLPRVGQVFAAIDHCYAVLNGEDVYSWGGAGASNGGTGRLLDAGTHTPMPQRPARPDIGVSGAVAGGVVSIVVSSQKGP